MDKSDALDRWIGGIDHSFGGCKCKLPIGWSEIGVLDQAIYGIAEQGAKGSTYKIAIRGFEGRVAWWGM